MEENKLTDKEKYRFDIIRSCVDGDITNKEASDRLGLKIRQIQILKNAGLTPQRIRLNPLGCSSEPATLAHMF